MDTTNDQEQIELPQYENSDKQPQDIQPSPLAMGYPYNPNENKSYPVQVSPQYNPTPQVAPIYIPPPIQVQNNPQMSTIYYGRQSITMTCPKCHQTMNTVIKRRPGWLIFILVLVFIAVFWPAFLMPLFFCCWYDIYHSCRNCKTSLGACQMITSRCCLWYKPYQGNKN